MLMRDNGSPRLAGNSQASALTCTTTSGGESPGASGPGALLKSRQAFVEEPFPPMADDLPPRVAPRGNLVVLQSLCGQEDHLGPLNLEIRQRIFLRPPLQHLCFLVGERDPEGTFNRCRGANTNTGVSAGENGRLGTGGGDDVRRRLEESLTGEERRKISICVMDFSIPRFGSIWS